MRGPKRVRRLAIGDLYEPGDFRCYCSAECWEQYPGHRDTSVPATRPPGTQRVRRLSGDETNVVTPYCVLRLRGVYLLLETRLYG